MSSSSKNENTKARKTESEKHSPKNRKQRKNAKEFKGLPQTDSEEKETRERKLTEKGKQYQRDILDSKVKASSTKLRQEITKIKELISLSGTSWKMLHRERDTLDQIKEEFNDAHHALHYLLKGEEEREASYHYFDLCDRECTECRIKES